jgi:hypothetical protein
MIAVIDVRRWFHYASSSQANCSTGAGSQGGEAVKTGNLSLLSRCRRQLWPQLAAALGALVMTSPCLGQIVSPTAISPVYFDSADDTDVTIIYEMSETVVDPLSLVYGWYVALDIFREDASEPVATLLHPNVLTTGAGETRVFHWNGYTNSLGRVRNGRYHARISLLNHALEPTGWSEREDGAIIIAVTDVEIDAASDGLLSRHGAMAGEDTLHIQFSPTAAIGYDEVVTRVYDEAGDEIAHTSTTSDLDGDIRWNGTTLDRETLPAGNYSVRVELKRGGERLGISEPHPFTVYEVDLQASGVEESDEEVPGVHLPTGQETNLTLVFRPAGTSLEGSVRLVDDTASESVVFSSGGAALDLATGIDYPLADLVSGVEFAARSTTFGGAPVELIAEYSPPSTPPGKTESDTLHLVLSGIDIDVDADRDGTVEASFEDDVGEDQWAVGSGNKGAIVLVNSDDDDGDHLPDNWTVQPGTDHTAWDGEPNDTVLNANPDADDIAPLIVRQTGLSEFPAGARITLTVSVPPDDPLYYSPVPAQRIRVFHPNPGSYVFSAGAEEIIGPDSGSSVDFVAAPGADERDITIFLGDGDVAFGMEGLVHGAMVDVRIEYRDASGIFSQDQVRVRTAPYIHFSQVKAVNTDPGAGQTVFVEERGESNADLRTALVDEFGTDHVNQASTGDVWHQDGYDPGYQAAPYKAMPLILGLPRGSGSLGTYTQEVLLRPGVGIVHNFQYPWAYSCGGDLEATPGEPERFFHGDYTHHDDIEAFIAAQGVQPQIALNTSFLAVGHVDELVSFAPDGRHVLVSSPEVAWALLLIAANIDDEARMLQGVAPVAASGLSVREVLDGYEDFNFNVVLSLPFLPRFRRELGLGSAAGSPVPDPANASDTPSLSRVGGLIGFMTGNRMRTFRLTFRDASVFDLEYRDGDGTWQSDGEGRYEESFVSDSRTAFILDRWWQAPSPSAGDSYNFTVNPRSSFIEVPVVFHRVDGGALAFTKNNVNSLVSGDTIITAQTVGPVVDWGEGAQDIFGYYIQNIYERAGFSNVVFADDLMYHNSQGSIHCGTNVLRRIPTRNWWE